LNKLCQNVRKKGQDHVQEVVGTDDVRNRVVWAEQPFIGQSDKTSFTVHIANISGTKASAFKTVGRSANRSALYSPVLLHPVKHLSLP